MLDSASLSWLRSELFIAIFAAIGGIIVLIGLWMEYVSTDEKRYESVGIDGFRSLKSKEKRGEKWVMWGILVEVAVAVVFACRDDAHIRQMKIAEERANPRNQPISEVTAFADLIVNGTNNVRTPEMAKWWDNGWVSILTLHKAGDSKYSGTTDFGELDADNFLVGVNGNFPNARVYFMQFHLDLFSIAGNIGYNRGTNGEIDDVKFVEIIATFLPPGSEILGGDVEVRAGSLIKLFKILPQKDPDPEDGNFPRPYWIFATNGLPANIIQPQKK
jgi:hypothetical protein